MRFTVVRCAHPILNIPGVGPEPDIESVIEEVPDKIAVEIAAIYTMHPGVDDRPISGYQSVNHAVAEMTPKFDAAYLLPGLPWVLINSESYAQAVRERPSMYEADLAVSA